MKNYFILSFLLSTLSIQTKELFIIIPGTWAKNESWHQYEGEFFTYLTLGARKLGHAVENFTWSGEHDHRARIVAGKRLARAISFLPRNMKINLVTHSHGTTVAIIASQELAKQNGDKKKSDHIKINTIYALGTPVDLKRYSPNMDVIKTFYNFFSLGDYVQPLFGMYSRVYPEHGRCANIRIKIDGKDPLHTQLHSSCIGRWLPYIHQTLATKKEGNFENFDFFAPGLIHFYSNPKKAPFYRLDRNRSYAYSIDTLEVLQNLPDDERDLMYGMLAHEDPKRIEKIMGKRVWKNIKKSNDSESSIQESAD